MNPNAKSFDPSGSSSSPTSTPQLSGAARFRIERELADTLQGRIYQGTDLVTGKTCVIKEAWRQLVESGRSRKGHRVPENFIGERQTLMKLSNFHDAHIGIVRGINQWEDESCLYYAMEHCSGELFEFVTANHTGDEYRKWIAIESNKAQIPMKKPSKWEITASKMFKQIVEATQWLHNKGYCHLDMSLENTMIATITNDTNINNVHVKIIDFGLAKHFANGNYLYQGRVGKLQYMCPEAYSRKRYDARAADVYTMGIMLFMMLIGAPPYPIPQPQNPAFNYFITGRIRDVLVHWKRIRLLTDDALDLLTKIIRYEKDRIGIQEILNHPFITNLDEDDEEEDKKVENENDVQMNTKIEIMNNNPDLLTMVNSLISVVSEMSVDVEEKEDENNNNIHKNNNNKQKYKENGKKQQQININNQPNKHQQSKNSHEYKVDHKQSENNYVDPYEYYKKEQRQQQKHNDNTNNTNNTNNHHNQHNVHSCNSYGQMLLHQFGLIKYDTKFGKAGYSNPKDWNKLDEMALKWEVGLNDHDAKSFMVLYNNFLQNNNNNYNTPN